MLILVMLIATMRLMSRFVGSLGADILMRNRRGDWGMRCDQPPMTDAAADPMLIAVPTRNDAKRGGVVES